VVPEDQERVRDAFNRSMEKGVRFQTEYRWRLRDGSLKILANQGQIQRSKKSGSLVLVGTVQDITSFRGDGDDAPAWRAQADALAESLVATGLDDNQRDLLRRLTALWRPSGS
jgi:hypothetical protein